MKPVCKNCGASGNDVSFNIFSDHGFGTFCVRCEELADTKALCVFVSTPLVDAKALRVIRDTNNEDE